MPNCVCEISNTGTYKFKLQLEGHLIRTLTITNAVCFLLRFGFFFAILIEFGILRIIIPLLPTGNL